MVTPTYTVVLSRGKCCSRQRSYVRLQWLARTCLLREDQHADRKHKAKMVTPTYTVVLLQIAIMLDSQQSQQARNTWHDPAAPWNNCVCVEGCTRILRNGGVWHQQRRIGDNNDMFLAMNARAPEPRSARVYTDARQPDHLSANNIRAPEPRRAKDRSSPYPDTNASLPTGFSCRTTCTMTNLPRNCHIHNPVRTCGTSTVSRCFTVPSICLEVAREQLRFADQPRHDPATRRNIEDDTDEEKHGGQ